MFTFYDDVALSFCVVMFIFLGWPVFFFSEVVFSFCCVVLFSSRVVLFRLRGGPVYFFCGLV